MAEEQHRWPPSRERRGTHSVFGDDGSSWMRSRYARLCAYAHSQAGYNNTNFRESNGPIFVPNALMVVEREFR
jgi:hypothetical protein